MKRLCLLLLVLLSWASAFAQWQMHTYQYAEKDGNPLLMDVYMPENINDSTITVVYVFGGGFVSGERNNSSSAEYCNKLADFGYIAVAIDYRLGLKGEKISVCSITSRWKKPFILLQKMPFLH